jgi:hypothetical protein
MSALRVIREVGDSSAWLFPLVGNNVRNAADARSRSEGCEK